MFKTKTNAAILIVFMTLALFAGCKTECQKIQERGIRLADAAMASDISLKAKTAAKVIKAGIAKQDFLTACDAYPAPKTKCLLAADNVEEMGNCLLK